MEEASLLSSTNNNNNNRRNWGVIASALLCVAVLAITIHVTNYMEEDVDVELYQWKGLGEASMRASMENAQKIGLIPKVKKYKWLQRGENSALRAIKTYHEAYPTPDYDWKDYASKSVIKELKESNVVHLIDSPYFSKQ